MKIYKQNNMITIETCDLTCQMTEIEPGITSANVFTRKLESRTIILKPIIEIINKISVFHDTPANERFVMDALGFQTGV